MVKISFKLIRYLLSCYVIIIDDTVTNLEEYINIVCISGQFINLNRKIRKLSKKVYKNPTFSCFSRTKYSK